MRQVLVQSLRQHGLNTTPLQRTAGAQFLKWNYRASIHARRGANPAPLRNCRFNSTDTSSSTLSSAVSSQSSALDNLTKRKWSTPLAETISKAIEVTGPISIASYMRQALTNPEGGYYTSAKQEGSADQFGKRGDFITSPEISQIFGELVGVWFLTEWMGQGRPKDGVQLIEVGPGRGTMIADVLRTASQFKAFNNAIEGVWLVEAGESLRRKQCDLLCSPEAILEHDGKGIYTAKSKYGPEVHWVEDIALLPSGNLSTSTGQKMPFIIAHEFFDALPIHAFESIAAAPEDEQKTQLLDKNGRPMVRQNPAAKVPAWRELLVTPTRPKIDLFARSSSGKLEVKQPDADFQLVIAKASNANSIVIPEGARYKALKNTPGSRVEVSPESQRYIQDFAKRIGGAGGNKPAGAALIIDYGPLDTIPVDSLRGIKDHKIVSPFAFAGQADISADVDFSALADAALEASEGVEVHGPIEQGAWLSQLGIQDRADRLMRGVQDTEKKEMIETGWKRLVEGGPRGMGKAYKVMCVLPEGGGKRRPVGFGGGVAG